MENGEIMFADKKDVDSSGFSEKRLDQDTEMQAGQWLDLTNKQRAKSRRQETKNNKQKTINKRQPSNNDQAVADLQKYSQELSSLIQQFVSLPSQSSKEANRIMQNIFTIQSRIKTLLQTLKRSS